MKINLNEIDEKIKKAKEEEKKKEEEKDPGYLFKKYIGNRIRELLAVKHKTPSELAKYIEHNGFSCTAKAVSNWTNGTDLPKLNRLLLIADFFDVSVDSLVRINPWEKSQNHKAMLMECGGAYLYELSGIVNILNQDGKEKLLEYAALLLRAEEYVNEFYLNENGLHQISEEASDYEDKFCEDRQKELDHY